MKLGEMQRYKFYRGLPTDEPCNCAMKEYAEGKYVLFSDAQAKSLADERSITDAEELLQELLKVAKSHHLGAVEPPIFERVRAALRVGDAK